MVKCHPVKGPVMTFDHLGLATDNKALKALTSNSAGNDTVVFSAKMLKINRHGKAQNRVLLITNRHIFNIMPDNYSKCNRCIDIRQLHHITTSSNDQEFAIHLAEEYDYRFKSALFQQAVSAIRAQYMACTDVQLEVVDVSSADELAAKVITKADLKEKGRSWGTNPIGKEEQERSTALAASSAVARDPISAASIVGGLPLLQEDEDEDSEADDEVAEIASDSDSELEEAAEATEMAGAPAPAPMTAGGAFAKFKHSVDDFVIIRVLGKGAFGKVMLVRFKVDQKVYAMKALSKATLLERNEVAHTRTERMALESTHHPYLVHLKFAFQSPQKLFLVMDYCNGGELFYHLKQSGCFEEPRAQLYAAQICSALHHLHGAGIIYRDLKPENVLLDHEGHVRITDFGLAKDAMDLNAKTHTFCGTPDYLAPEVIKGSGHGRGVDWWSLGTMIYEMLGGLPPFYAENFNVMYDRILHAPLEFRPLERFQAPATALIAAMLQKDPALRLGSSERDGEDIKAHEWFANIDWAKLDRREILPSFKPSVQSETDTSNFDEEFTSSAIESVRADSERVNETLGKGNEFEGFSYRHDPGE